MTAPQSSALPDAPQRNESEDVFVEKANAFVAALEPFRVELQEQSDFVNSELVNLDDVASAVAESATIAVDASNLAQAAGNYIGEWSSLTGSVAAGVSVAHIGEYWGSLVAITDVTLSEPGTSSDWQSITELSGTAAQRDTGTDFDQVPINTNIVYPVDTVADLRLLEPTVDGQRFNVTSYYDGWAATVRGPVGGGEFVYNASDTTSIDDGIKVFVTSSGARIKRVLSVCLTPSMAGVKGSGNDDTERLQSYVNNADNIIIDDAYSISSTLTIDSSKTIEFVGSGEIKTLSGFIGNVALDISGSLSQVSALTNRIVSGDGVVGIGTGHGLLPDDVFIIYNPTDFSWSGHRSVYRAGEFCQVHSVLGNNTVFLTGQTYDTYEILDVDLYKMDKLEVTIINPKITCTDGSVSTGLKVSLATKVKVSGDDVSGFHSTGVEYNKCFNVFVSASTSRCLAAAAGNQYGVMFANCQNWSFHGNPSATRHSIGIGGGDSIGCVTNRAGHIYNSTLGGLKSSGVPTADMHGNVEDVQYSNCHMMGGAQFAGKNVSYNDCKIYEVDSSGVSVLGAEIIGGTHTLRDCEIISRTDTKTGSRGVVYFSLDDKLSSNFNVLLTNNTYKITNQAAGFSVVRIDNNGGALGISATIDGAEIESNLPGSVINVQLISGTALTKGFVVDNIKSDRSGMELMSADGDYHLLPLRLQRQNGQVSISVGSSVSSAVATAQTYRYKYPRQPYSLVSAFGVDGNALGSTGSLPAIARSYRTKIDTIEPSVCTYDLSSTFGAGGVVRVGWEVGINEI